MLAVAKGDAQAFNALVRRHLPRAYAIAKRVLMNQPDAEEAAQDAFNKIWIRACDWQPGRAKFTTWMHRIVVNAALDIARKRHGGAVSDPDAVLATIADASPSVETVLSDAERDQQLHRALSELTAEQRAAITLCYFEQHTNPEAAKLMGINIKALEGLLVRARKKLRDILKDTEVRHAA